MTKALRRARNAALRQRFLLGAAMANLQKATEESKEVMANCGIDLDGLPPRVSVLDGWRKLQCSSSRTQSEQ